MGLTDSAMQNCSLFCMISQTIPAVSARTLSYTVRYFTVARKQETFHWVSFITVPITYLAVKTTVTIYTMTNLLTNDNPGLLKKTRLYTLYYTGVLTTESLQPVDCG